MSAVLRSLGNGAASVLDLIGHTPVVELRRLSRNGVRLFAKLESFNPGGSVKDRMALAIIEDAERRGLLRPGQTVVEASSGNTGIALAMVCAARGYPLIVAMAENFSLERRRLLRLLGAKVVLTPAALKGSGMVAKARELAQAHDAYYCDQFNNPANAEAHRRSTAQEILDHFAGQRLDALVLGAGTGGSVAGLSEVLKRQRPDCRICVCEPANARLLGSGLAQPRDATGAISASHPAFRPHPVQGWTPDFIPSLLQQAQSQGRIDRLLAIDGEVALHCARELARREGILAGISSGATLAGALQLSDQLPRGSKVLCLLADSAERYLSTALFDGIEDEMNAEEWALSRSTPGARFDLPARSEPAPVSPDPVSAPEPEVLGRLLKWINDPTQPVLLVGLTWCEFAQATARLLQTLKVPFRQIHLDSPELDADGTALPLRRALQGMTGQPTLPQLFIGGDWIGGCSDVFEAARQGVLQRRLRLHGLSVAESSPELNRLLPRWVHARQPATSSTPPGA